MIGFRSLKDGEGLHFPSCREEETLLLGRRIGKHLREGHILCMFGRLGSGKTLMARGISEGARGTSKHVRSPTFTFINQYPGPFTIYHVDLYRIGSLKEIVDIGLEELLSPNSMIKTGAILIEWAERLEDSIPGERINIHIQVETSKTRNIWLQAFGKTHRSLIHAIYCDSDSTIPLPKTDSEFEKLASPADRS